MKKGLLIAVAVLSIIGAVIAGVSVSQRLRIEKYGFEESSFCAINEKINCDIVNASSYSEFANVPVAWWGLCFYALIAALSIYSAFSPSSRRSTIAFMWFVSVAGIAASFYFACIAYFVLGVLCIECVGMYIINLAIFILLFISLGVKAGLLPQFVFNYAKYILKKGAKLDFNPQIIGHSLISLVIFGIGIFLIMSIKSGRTAAGDVATLDEKARAFYMQSLYSIDVDPNWPLWGNPDGKTTIVEFSEFQCPFCKIAAFNIKPYLREFKKDVRFYFVNYPLDQSCNDEIKQPMHQFACLAAKAGYCANKRGDFWGYHDDIFRNQKNLNEELVYSLAEKRGWNRDEFKTCIDSPEILSQIKKDIAAGKKIYVTGTPTIFMNDRKLKYWPDPKFLQRIVKEEIKRVKK